MKIQLMMTFLLNVGLVQCCQQVLIDQSRGYLNEAIHQAFEAVAYDGFVVNQFDSSLSSDDKMTIIQNCIEEWVGKRKEQDGKPCIGGIILNSELLQFKDATWSKVCIPSNNVSYAVQDCGFIVISVSGKAFAYERPMADYSLLANLLQCTNKRVVIAIAQDDDLAQVKKCFLKDKIYRFGPKKGYSFSSKILVGGGILAALAAFLYYCQSVRYN